MASKAVELARGRRITRAIAGKARIDILVDKIANGLQLPVQKRVALATEYVKATVIKNISISVGREVDPVTKHVTVTQRSLPGEYPRADTTMLMKTIFSETKENAPGSYSGFIGTPLDYGLVLETSLQLDRRFLSRTLEEEYSKVIGIMLGSKNK